MAFAGLWERWTVPDGIAVPRSLAAPQAGDAVETCTILTTGANSKVAPIHARMPAIVPPESFDPWLEGCAVALGPWPADGMTIRAVGTRVNNASNDDPGCIEPLAVL